MHGLPLETQVVTVHINPGNPLERIFDLSRGVFSTMIYAGPAKNGPAHKACQKRYDMYRATLRLMGVAQAEVIFGNRLKVRVHRFQDWTEMQTRLVNYFQRMMSARYLQVVERRTR